VEVSMTEQLDLFHEACVRQQAISATVNRLTAYAVNGDEFNQRELAIVRLLGQSGPMTDRAMKEKLFGEAADMNTVRPRVNDLLRRGAIEVVGNVPDHVTGHKVRVVAVKQQ